MKHSYRVKKRAYLAPLRSNTTLSDRAGEHRRSWGTRRAPRVHEAPNGATAMGARTTVAARRVRAGRHPRPRLVHTAQPLYVTTRPHRLAVPQIP